MSYSLQTFSVGQVLQASHMTQVEANIRDHVHGASGVSVSGLVMVGSPTSISGSPSTVDFTSLDSSYDLRIFVLTNVKVGTDDIFMAMRVGTGAGPTYQTTGYRWSSRVQYQGSGSSDHGASLDGYSAGMLLTDVAGSTGGIGNAANESFSAIIEMPNPGNADFCDIRFRCAYSGAFGGQTDVIGGCGRYDTAGAITALRFYLSSGTFSSGTITQYGLQKS